MFTYIKSLITLSSNYIKLKKENTVLPFRIILINMHTKLYWYSRYDNNYINNSFSLRHNLIHEYFY